MPTRVDYQQFITTLKKLIEKKSTTNLIVLTEDNHSLWIGLINGVITSIIYGPKRGKAALPLISKILGGKLSLDTKTNLPPMQDLPSTEVILAQLAGTPHASNEAKLTPSFDSTRTNLIIEQLQRLLTQYIGPIANMIMPNIIKQIDNLSTESQFHELIDRMAKEVDGIGDTEKFCREAVEILQKM